MYDCILPIKKTPKEEKDKLNFILPIFFLLLFQFKTVKFIKTDHMLQTKWALTAWQILGFFSSVAMHLITKHI